MNNTRTRCVAAKARAIYSRLVFLILLTMLLLSSVMLQAQPSDTKAETLLRGIMEKEHIPGLAYAVVRNGNIEAMGTLGKASIPFDINVNRQTVFQLASVSKIYCALLLGKLFDKGLLRPDQTLGELIDSVPEFWKRITVLQLAAHQSGIKIADFSKAVTTADALAIAKQMPIDYPAGTKSEYLSSDYWVITWLVEKVTGMKYYEALKKYVLDPLGMRHTFVNNPKTGGITDLDIIPQQAQEYHWFKQESVLRINQMWFGATGYAAGGIYSSIEDMATVAAAFDKGDFMSPATKALVTNAVLLSNGTPGNYGMGLVVRDNYAGYKIIEHSGGPALADFLRFDQERLTIIILTNNRGVYPYLAKQLATLYMKGLPEAKAPEGWE